ncbi:unnamed protein product [marine sediment metagenome]|uniref:Helix-turn-helix type 11 domain-containing protein n=1 Tax=marine sediment metagenome TaxID=412755 RepID=X0VI78_9ZZZZ
MTAAITMDEWLAEFEKVSEFQGDEGATVRELSEQMGHESKWVRDHLREAIDKGRVAVGRRKYLRIDGTLTMVPVYRINPETSQIKAEI